METNRKSLIEALRAAVQRAEWDGGVVKMSVQVAEVIIEELERQDGQGGAQ